MGRPVRHPLRPRAPGEAVARGRGAGRGGRLACLGLAERPPHGRGQRRDDRAPGRHRRRVGRRCATCARASGSRAWPSSASWWPAPCSSPATRRVRPRRPRRCRRRSPPAPTRCVSPPCPPVHDGCSCACRCWARAADRSSPARSTPPSPSLTKNVGPLPVTLTKTGRGVRTGLASLPLSGHWQLAVTVRTSAIDEATAYVACRWADPAGQPRVRRRRLFAAAPSATASATIESTSAVVARAFPPESRRRRGSALGGGGEGEHRSGVLGLGTTSRCLVDPAHDRVVGVGLQGLEDHRRCLRQRPGRHVELVELARLDRARLRVGGPDHLRDGLGDLAVVGGDRVGELGRPDLVAPARAAPGPTPGPRAATAGRTPPPSWCRRLSVSLGTRNVTFAYAALRRVVRTHRDVGRRGAGDQQDRHGGRTQGERDACTPASCRAHGRS